MSGIKSFVTETELEDEKKRRQEEWDKVRTAEMPKEAPEPEFDRRSLYDRLKEQKDKKQYEEDEDKKFKHMVRGLDSDEVGFLDFVDNMKAAEESKRRLEEKRLIEEIHKTMESGGLIDEPAASTALLQPAKKAAAKPKAPSKQAQLIAACIKKRPSENKSESNGDDGPSEKKRKSTDTETAPKIVDATSMSLLNDDKCTPASSVQIVGIRPSAMKPIGVLPGLGSYSPTSDSSDDSQSSDSDENCLLFSNPVEQLIQSEAKAASAVDTSKRNVSSTSGSQTSA